MLPCRNDSGRCSSLEKEWASYCELFILTGLRKPSLLRPIHTRTICSRPTGIGRFPYEESADGYIPTGASVLESADYELESADSSADFNADASKVGMWLWAFNTNEYQRLGLIT